MRCRSKRNARMVLHVGHMGGSGTWTSIHTKSAPSLHRYKIAALTIASGNLVMVGRGVSAGSFTIAPAFG